MRVFDRIAELGHEQVVFCHDPASGYRGIIAIHSTVLGPAVGGTRFWQYTNDNDALTDALRLSRGMTFKNAVAGMEVGGGKAVVLQDNSGGDNRRADRESLFRAHGRFVESLGGRFITGEDVGTSPSDMEIVSLETRHVGGIVGKGGDPSPWTARGVFRGIQASAKYRWGADELAGRTVAIQGCGNVGYHLARELREAGARLIVADVNAERAKRVVRECFAVAVAPEEIYGVRADIFAPCALGAIINDRAIPALKVEIVAGAANNQLLEERHGDELEARGILYAPDYVINAGGVISGGVALHGWDATQVKRKVEAIYDTLLRVFDIARSERLPNCRAADLLAERILQEARAA